MVVFTFAYFVQDSTLIFGKGNLVLMGNYSINPNYMYYITFVVRLLEDFRYKLVELETNVSVNFRRQDSLRVLVILHKDRVY